MSIKNPTVKEVLGCTTGQIGEHFCKSYLQLAKMEFRKKHRRCPTIADAQEVRDFYESQWVDYYIHKPAREKENRRKGRPIWEFGCYLRIDVYAVMCRFFEFKYGEFIDCPDRSYSDQWYDIALDKYGYYKNSCGDILKEKGIEFMETFIIDSGLLEEWKSFAQKVKSKYPYYKRTYQDFSHLAYNNVADDF